MVCSQNTPPMPTAMRQNSRGRQAGAVPRFAHRDEMQPGVFHAFLYFSHVAGIGGSILSPIVVLSSFCLRGPNAHFHSRRDGREDRFKLL